MTIDLRVCLVDDEPDKAELILRPSLGADVILQSRHPSEVTLEELRIADVVLVDYELHVSWSRPHDVALARHPVNGLALAGVYRAHLLALPDPRPQAIALYSAELGLVGGQLPPEVRGHALARLHDLEWVFPKAASAGIGIRELGEAVRALHAIGRWPEDALRAEGQLHHLLALPARAPWRERAANAIEDCFPPVHELSELSHSLALLRWIAHRVLPYPCFLKDRFAASAHLRLRPSDFDALIASDTKYSKELRRVQYCGVLEGFLETRWWGAGLDDCLWRWTRGSFSGRDLRDVLSKSGLDVSLPVIEPVVVINDAYQPCGVEPVEEAVRVQPDDWPPFAESAWVRVADALSSSRLAGLVIREDRVRLQED